MHHTSIGRRRFVYKNLLTFLFIWPSLLMVRFSCIRRLKYEVCRLMQSDGNSSQESYQPSKLVEKKKTPKNLTHKQEPMAQNINCISISVHFYILNFTSITFLYFWSYLFQMKQNSRHIYKVYPFLLQSDTTYVIKFVSDLGQFGGFLWVLQFPPPIKLTTTI
jgi:hypothetical protein